MPYSGIADIQLQLRLGAPAQTTFSLGGDQFAALINKGHLLWTPIKLDKKQVLTPAQRATLAFRKPQPDEESREDEEGNAGRWYTDWADAATLGAAFDALLQHLLTEHQLDDGAVNALHEALAEYAKEDEPPHPLQMASSLRRAVACYDGPLAQLGKARDLAQAAALCGAQVRLIYDLL